MGKYFIKNDFGELRDKFYNRFKRGSGWGYVSNAPLILSRRGGFAWRASSDEDYLIELGYTELTLKDFEDKEGEGEGVDEEKNKMLNPVYEKPTYEKLYLTLWDIANIREDLESGRLYFFNRIFEEMNQLETVEGVAGAIRIDNLYRKSQVVGLDDEVYVLGCYVKGDSIMFEDGVKGLRFECVKNLYEILKRHGKI